MTLGEGAAVLVIEAEETARQRGAPILARLTGWGASCDAHHITAPHPEGAGALAAMQSALNRAGLDPSAIDYVNAHGTGTRDNDQAEAKALKQLFGGRIPPFSSTKRFFGHALAASGAIEAVICVEALRRQQLPPEPGVQPAPIQPSVSSRSPSCGPPLTHVMSNSFGFGGNNSVLVFSRAGSRRAPRPPRPGPVAVTGVGVIGPGSAASGRLNPLAMRKPFRLRLRCGPTVSSSSRPQQRRRLNRLGQMAWFAREPAILPNRASGWPWRSALAWVSWAPLGLFWRTTFPKTSASRCPRSFRLRSQCRGLRVAIDLGAAGQNSAPTAAEISFECALWQGISQLAADEADCALAGAADELNKYLLGIGKRWGMWNEPTPPGRRGAGGQFGPERKRQRRSAASRRCGWAGIAGRLTRSGKRIGSRRQSTWRRSMSC